jgi:hypothetical protein
MKEDTVVINLNGEALADIDCSAIDSFVGITDKNNNIVTQFNQFTINQEFKFPVIRQVNDALFLVAEARVDEPSDNCFLFDFKGNQRGQFFAGDGIQDIEIMRNNIIVSYFDEGVFGIDGPNSDGLSVFDLNGQAIFGYNQRNRGSIISDCYCMCKHSLNTMLFFPYTEFPLIELNVDTWQEKVHNVPEEVKGSNAITSVRGDVIFHAPYDDKRALFKWSVGEKRAKRFGEYTRGASWT